MRFRLVHLMLPAAMVVLAMPLPALASGSIAVTYFVLPETHPDVGHGIDGSIVKNLVRPHLGPHGFPVATNFARTTGGPASGKITDLNADGEIMWWSTSGNGVRADGSGAEKMPLDDTAEFPRGQNGDLKGFRTAHFHGTFVATAGPQPTLKLGSDDDAWVFVDGRLAVDNGGVKPEAFTPYDLGPLTPGSHVLDIFYADRHGSGAAIEIDATFAIAPARIGAIPAAARPAGHPSLTASQMRAALKKTGRFTLRDIHFAFNKTDITRDSAAVLGEVGKLMQSDPSLRLRVEGHTDNVGGEDYNLDLSQRRAAAVKAYIVAHAHVAASRLETAGYGFTRPVASNATAKGQALNRRVEFVKL